MIRRLACAIAVLVGTWVGGVRLANASCEATHIEVFANPISTSGNLVPVMWRVDPECVVIETGLLLGTDPTALAPAGQPIYG